MPLFVSLTGKDFHSSWMPHGHGPLKGQEVHIVGRVDRLCHSINVVCHRNPSTKLGIVLNVINSSIFVTTFSSVDPLPKFPTHIKLALWSI